MTVIFADGTQVPYLNAIETEEYWGGASRRTLTFTCAADAVSVDALNALLGDAANTAGLSLTNEELGVTNLYEGYTLKLKVGIEPVLTQPDAPDAPAQYADRLVFKLGKPTYIEAQLARLGLSGAQ